MINQSQDIPFEEIVNNESLILIDSGLSTGKPGEAWYRIGVYEAKKYSELDADILHKWIAELRDLSNLLLRPNIRTVEKVVDEFVYTRELLREKLIKLNGRQMTIKKLHRDKYRIQQGCEETEFKKGLLEELCFLYHEVQRVAKRTVLDHFDQNKFNLLERAVISIAEVSWAKRDFSYPYKNSFRKKEGDSHTDEQLVAAALYLSILDGTESCILTKDSHIKRILKNAYAYLTCNEIPINKIVLEALREKPIRAYFVKGQGTVDLEVDTS